MYYIQSFCGLNLGAKNNIILENNRIVHDEPNEYNTQKWVIQMIWS